MINVNSFGGGLGAGLLSANQFSLGSSASSFDHRFVYDASNGNLFFDADGNGANAQIHIAALSNLGDLSFADFDLV